jgi:hypothetical protein
VECDTFHEGIPQCYALLGVINPLKVCPRFTINLFLDDFVPRLSCFFHEWVGVQHENLVAHGCYGFACAFLASVAFFNDFSGGFSSLPW